MSAAMMVALTAALLVEMSVVKMAALLADRSAVEWVVEWVGQ